MRWIVSSIIVLLTAHLLSGSLSAKGSQDSTKVYVFLDFSCPVCQYYLHTIQSLADEFSPKGVSFAAVFPTEGVTADTLAYYAGKYQFRIPLIIDTSQTLTTRYDAKVTPEAIVIASTGEVVYRGRIDNMFIKLGRRRQAPTTSEVRNVLLVLSDTSTLPAYTYTAPIGCLIERKKR